MLLLLLLASAAFAKDDMDKMKKPMCGSVYGSCDTVPNSGGEMKYCCNKPDDGCPEGFKEVKDPKYRVLCMPDGSGKGGDKRCKANEFYSECGSPCETNCDTKDIEGMMCMTVCEVGCFCDKPYIRKSGMDKTCVLPEKCMGGKDPKDPKDPVLKMKCNQLKKQFKGRTRKEKLAGACDERKDCEMVGTKCKRKKMPKVNCKNITDKTECEDAGCDAKMSKRKGLKCRKAKKPKPGPQKCKFDKEKYDQMKSDREDPKKPQRTGQSPLTWGLYDDTCKCKDGYYGYCMDGECGCYPPTKGRPYSAGRKHLSSDACRFGGW